MVLFTSNRPLNRAENIKAVYDCYDGEKDFIQTDPLHYNPALASKKYKVRVTDEFVWLSQGKTIMIGHGISGGKSYGLDQPRAYHRRENGRFITYAISTSEAMNDLVARQCGVAISSVLALGMPRTDAYIGRRKGDGRTLLADKRSYLFAPTWRNSNEPKAPEIDYDILDKILTDDEIFAVKPHMITGNVLKKHYRHIVEISSEEPSTPYLIDCDVLITDYSSIMLDAHVLDKPVVIFEKEKGYVEKRGLYLKYPEEYASRYCTNEKDLIFQLRTAFEPGEADIKCKMITASACDGHSSERVVKLIKGML